MIPELNYPFDSSQILRSRKKLQRRLLEQGTSFIHKKIALLSGSTIGEIAPILELFLLNYGIKAEFWIGQYNQYYEDAIYGNNELAKFSPDYIYIHTTNKNISRFPESTDTEELMKELLEQDTSRFTSVWNSLFDKYRCIIIQNNFELAPFRLFGNSDAVRINGRVYFITRLNEKFHEFAQTKRDFFINDINYQSAWFGLERWFDPAQWYQYKYALSMDAIPLLCFNLANIIKSTLGKNKKALALDLDNTLWGGIIGDDGINGIELGIETPKGMAFFEFQSYIKSLCKTGISLAVCSKNEEATAKNGFSHPASVLSVEDFVSFYANWDDKPKNVDNILRDINILPESLVFLDDNPMERDIVRSQFADICIPRLEQPEQYLRTLDQSGFFEATIITNDDQIRNQTLKANILRESSRQQFGDHKDYLRSLLMEAFFYYISVENITRVTQLINKTNQFNLTTQRYTEPEVLEFAENSESIAFCVRLQDRFGDNGMVSVLLSRIVEDSAMIDLWVMSCRVFRRDLEFAMFDELVRRCREAGVVKIKGKFIPTKKNELVESLYLDLGFTQLSKDENGTLWEYVIPNIYINKNTVILQKGTTNE